MLKKLYKVILFIILNLNFSYCTLDIHNSEVTLSYGQLRGFYNGQYYSFLGVPYAEPPIGINRFEPPKYYIQKWNETRDATEYSSVCMQWSHFIENGDQFKGEEDCLYLNIYTKSLNLTAKLPVIVYIHGGAFMYGTSYFFGPNYLITEQIMFIDINYRLGPLGFLSTDDDIIPGNMGLKDQVMALKWIKENIGQFGGDPGNVIITGFSAGGASVHLHYMSQLSVGLFSKGISHSGCAINPWVLMENSLTRAQIIANNVNCPINDTLDMVTCLKEKSAEEIVRSVSLLQPWMYSPFSPFGVVVEKTKNAPFLSEHPINYLRNGLITNAPWIAIAVTSEGLYPASSFLKEGILEELDKNWIQYAPLIMHYNDTVDENLITNVSLQIRSHYLNNEMLTENSFYNLQQMIGDRLFIVDIQKSLRLQGNLNASNVYFIYYNFKSQVSVSYILAQKKFNFVGACHGDDITIFLENTMLNNHTSEEKEMSKKFVELYYSYATSSIPKFGESFLKKIEAYDNQFKFLKVDDNINISIQTENDLGHNHFWNSLPINENEKIYSKDTPIIP